MSLIALPYPQLIDTIRAVTPGELPIYLVGGAVRDLLLSRPIHDLDFVLPSQGIATARRAANALGAAFFPLDIERDAGRALYDLPDGQRLCLDFTSYRGPDLESDLRDRDFTINAIALDIRSPEHAVDPTGGMNDIRSRKVRACSPTALTHDPVRVIRAVRQAVSLEFQIEPETRQLIRTALPLLDRVSIERLRDELFKMLDGPRPIIALHTLDVLGGLGAILPELGALRDVPQSLPHTYDVWNHTLEVVRQLHTLFEVLQPEQPPESANNWIMGMVSVRIGRYRQAIAEHLAKSLNPERSLRALLLLAALYHDVGKPATRQIDEDGQIHFYQHDQAGADLAAQRAERLHLSNDEIERLKTVVRYHLRPLLLAQGEAAPTRRAIYRYFRDTGLAGVDICLLSLADTLATYGPGVPEKTWVRQLDVVRALLEAWWEQAETQVAPPPLLTGHDLIQDLGLSPGRQIGKLLEEVREAQAAGEISDREQAIEYARTRLDRRQP